jgi:hypothetical protein
MVKRLIKTDRRFPGLARVAFPGKKEILLKRLIKVPTGR